MFARADIVAVERPVTGFTSMSTLSAEVDPFSPLEVARVSRRVTLPHGRGLGIAEFGPPNAPPVLYFHGWPSSRLEPAILPVGRVRIIAVDRPGYGLSDAVSGDRRLADWPADIEGLLNAWGLERVAVFGMSGGAPYAAAVAALIPDRVASLALVSGLGPPDVDGMSKGRMRMLLGFGRAPIRRKIVFNSVRSALLDQRNERRILAFRRNFVARGNRDAQAFTDGFGRRLLACWREGLMRGIEGAASDARIYGEPWPFDPADISVPTAIWHGERDLIVPCAVGHSYAAKIPHARQHFIPEEGHISLVAFHLENILDELLSRF